MLKDRPRPGKRSTIRDVARMAGVTPSTVSRLLNGKPLPIPVTEETRQRVLEAVRKLDYRPNRLARGLSAAQTFVLGMSFPITEPVKRRAHMEVTWFNFGMRVSGAKHIAQERGYDIHLVHRVEHDYDLDTPPPRMCMDFLDGLIYIEPNPRYPYYAELADLGAPMVIEGPNPLDRPWHCVSPDNRAEAHRLVKALLAKGHRRVGFLVGTPNDPPLDVLHRIEGYRQAHQAAGVPLDPDLLRIDHIGDLPLADVMDRLLDARPTALIIGRPELAVESFARLRARRLRSPRDLDVVVIGDDRAFEMLRPGVTATRLSYFDYGAEAAQLLIDAIEGRQTTPRQIAVPWSLVERETCILGDAYDGPRSDPYAAERKILQSYDEDPDSP